MGSQTVSMQGEFNLGYAHAVISQNIRDAAVIVFWRQITESQMRSFSMFVQAVENGKTPCDVIPLKPDPDPNAS